MPAASVDAVITDPPYSTGTSSNGVKVNWYDNSLVIPFFHQWFSEIKRVLKDDGEFYINTDWRTYPLLYPAAVSNLVVKNCIVWDYEWIKAGSHYRFSHEFIIYGLKNNETKRRYSASERDVWRIPPINFTSGEKNHQAEKPLNLLFKMLNNSTNEGDTILDPFMGSGTTGVACVRLNRNFIGIEINPAYFEIAQRRIAEAQAQMTLNFAEATA